MLKIRIIEPIEPETQARNRFNNHIFYLLQSYNMKYQIHLYIYSRLFSLAKIREVREERPEQISISNHNMLNLDGQQQQQSLQREQVIWYLLVWAETVMVDVAELYFMSRALFMFSLSLSEHRAKHVFGCKLSKAEAEQDK